jgi:hypothetical protein
VSGSFRLPQCRFTLGEFNAGDFEDAPDYGGRQGWHATLADSIYPMVVALTAASPASFD